MPESPSHQRYMTTYNAAAHRARIEASGALAKPASTSTQDWIEFYTKLYNKLGLQSYLPTVLSKLRA